MTLPILLAVLAATPAAAVPTAEAATRAAVARVVRLNPALHAVIALDPTARVQARALDRATRRGPLFGVPVLIKDNIEAGPLPTTAGSLALAANRSGRDAPLVTRLRASGAVILGKTNLSEWANIRSPRSISGWSAVGGQARNPHDLTRSPCGSSAGSAAAVASGMVAAAIGTETDGSITCPAAMTGVVGLKPTLGLVSRSGIVPISRFQDTAGPIAAYVTMAARLLGAIAGCDPADPATASADAHAADYLAALRPDALRGVRIGVMRFAEGHSPGADTVFEGALELLRRQGAILVDIATPGIDSGALNRAESAALHSELKADLDAYLSATPPGVTVRSLADVIAFNEAHRTELTLFGQETFVAAQATTAPDAAARTTAVRIARDGLARLLDGNDVVALVQPTEAPAFPIDPVNGDAFTGMGPGGTMAAVAGTPHLTVPMGAVRGLPVGLSFLGPAWRDARLLGLGYAFEQARR